MDRDLQAAFEHKTWADEQKASPRSGRGSTPRQTRRLRRALPGLLRDLEVKTFLDASCGYWTWMQAVDLGEENRPLSKNGDHANFNPMTAPFNFPKPIRHIPESHYALDLDEVTPADVVPWKRRRTMGLRTHDQLGAVLAALGGRVLARVRHTLTLPDLRHGGEARP